MEMLKQSEALAVRGLKAVRMRKSVLLQRVRDSKAKHVQDYAEAKAGFQKKLIADLSEALKLAKAGAEFRAGYHLEEPEDHSKDYDRVIEMLEVSLDEEVDLPASEFAKYVLDEWEWKGRFEHTVTRYKAR
jgi:hypothetical protein